MKSMPTVEPLILSCSPGTEKMMVNMATHASSANPVSRITTQRAEPKIDSFLLMYEPYAIMAPRPRDREKNA